MSRYHCVCGVNFRKKEKAAAHIELVKANQCPDYHLILERLWRGRLADWLWNYPWGRMFRGLGFYILFFTVIHHFAVNFSITESILIGIGLGLYIE